jgi:hypothetical protein
MQRSLQVKGTEKMTSEHAGDTYAILDAKPNSEALSRKHESLSDTALVTGWLPFVSLGPEGGTRKLIAFRSIAELNSSYTDSSLKKAAPPWLRRRNAGIAFKSTSDSTNQKQQLACCGKAAQGQVEELRNNVCGKAAQGRIEELHKRPVQKRQCQN